MKVSDARIAAVACCCLISVARTADAFRPSRGDVFPSPPTLRTLGRSPPASAASSSASLRAFKWPTLPSFDSAPAKREKTVVGERNGLDAEYPYRFEGRFVFRPSLVRVSDEVRPPSSALLSLFGYSLGGSVVLEYDVSPVGPYREYVTMGGVVAAGKVDVGDEENGVGKTLGVGQWGTDLYVSTQIAEDVCKEVWGVPAQVADIDFAEGGDVLADGPDDEETANGGRRRFTLSGWDNARVPNVDAESKRYGGIPIYWTPTIKALWAPLLILGLNSENASDEQLLPLHKLRLSASALRVKRCNRIKSPMADGGGEIPLGLALVVDNVLIEIGERVTGGGP